MAEITKELTIRPIDWRAAAEEMLAQAMRSDTLAGVEALEMMVRAGEASLFGVFSGPRLCGAYVLRIEQKPNGNEGVIVAAAGRLNGFRLVDLLPHVERQFIGCRAVRIHTARPGMMKALKRAGYSPHEIIFSKGL